ncbi:hypothetical protein GC169_08555 [bacterium]|nr:hypothetical protein [bacterium]
MFRLKLAFISSFALMSGACATVSVYEPVTSEISLVASQSELQSASEAYCKTARAEQWASGEASLGGLAGLIMGKQQGPSLYATRIEAQTASPTAVINRVRADVQRARAGLDGVSTIARTLLASTTPSRDDVNEFERALIHARQSRASFEDALQHVNVRVPDRIELASALGPLDTSIATARRLADDLAAARSASPSS